MINALIVNYSAANLTGFAGGQPANGDLVEVQGTSFDSGTTTLTATRVDKQMSDQEEAGNHEDMEREVSSPASHRPLTLTLPASLSRPRRHGLSHGTEADLAST